MSVKMPEPVAWLRNDQLRKLGRPYSDVPLNQRADSMMLHAKGTPEAAEQYGFDVAVITTDQAEAYADARVREVLRSLLRDMNGHVRTAYSRFGETGKPYDEGRRIAYEQAAADIRALIPPLPGPAIETKDAP